HAHNLHLLSFPTRRSSDQKIIRMILENSAHKEIPLSDDLRILELYLQLEKARLQDRFSYKIEVAAPIDPENTLVPPLILQPIVRSEEHTSELQSRENLVCR